MSFLLLRRSSRGMLERPFTQGDPMMRCGRRLAVALAVALVSGLAVEGLRPSATAGEPLDDRLGVRTTLLFLLLRSDIQKDLALEPAQVVELNRFANALYRKALTLKGKNGPGVVAARRAIDEEESNWLRSHLRPEQHERLGQIDLQWEGASALLSRPVIAEYLGLTAEQQGQIARVYNDARKKRGGAGPWTYKEHLEITKKAIALLSEKQQHFWARVLGRPCEFVIAAPAAPAAGGQKAGGR